LQQGYECTRRYLTEFITSPSSDDGVQLQIHSGTAAGNACIAQADVQNSLNPDVNVMEYYKLSTPWNRLSNSSGAPDPVDCSQADGDILPWCAAPRQDEACCGLDSSYSEASVLETQV